VRLEELRALVFTIVRGWNTIRSTTVLSSSVCSVRVDAGGSCRALEGTDRLERGAISAKPGAFLK